jgi:hypothetical protein
MNSSQFTAEPSPNDTAERDFTAGDVPGVLRSPAPGGEGAPFMFDVIIAVAASVRWAAPARCRMRMRHCCTCSESSTFPPTWQDSS